MRGAAIALFAISCAAPAPVAIVRAPVAQSAPPARAIEEEPITRVRVTLEASVLHVELGFYEHTRFERAPRGFTEFLSARDGPWTGRFAARDGIVRAAYDVRLEHHLAAPVRGLDDVPHPTAGGWVLVGRAFLPRTMRLWDGRNIETPVELRIEGDTIASVPERDGTFAGESLAELGDALYVVGNYRSRVIERGGARVTLVTSDFDDAALATMTDLVTRALELGERELGPLPAGELFIVHDRNPSGIDGSVTGRAVSVLSETGPTGRARADDGIVTVHELVHLWNRSDTWWINEGFARWWELRLTLALDRAADADARAGLNRIYERYVQSAEGNTIETSEGSFGYAAGALIALCAETHLRREGTTLGAVHRTAREASEQTRSSTVSREAFMIALGNASPAAREEIERLLAMPGPIDVDPCLARAGLRLARDGSIVPRRTRDPVSIFAAP